MKKLPALLAATILWTTPAFGQTATEHIVMGDRDHANRNAEGALAHYQAAIGVDPENGEALWRASREAIDLGEFNEPVRDSLYRLGEQYARRAVQADPNSSMAHFALAKALGRRALSLGARDRVKYAGEVRKEALESLRLDSLNSGALAVMGLWHANVMRLSGVSRFLAKNLLGGKVFDEANWDDAIRYLERAVAVDPERIVFQLNLGEVYEDREQTDKAREHFQTALRLPQTDFNDPHYQAQAEAGLRRLQ